MPISELDDHDDEDWYDDESDDAGDPDGESAPCPECGESVHVITGKCPSCGYWLTEADRQAMWTGEGKSMWLKVTAIVLLTAMLVSIAMGVF